jgi:hypothetical protein
MMAYADRSAVSRADLGDQGGAHVRTNGRAGRA